MEKNDLNIVATSLKAQAIEKIDNLMGYFQFKGGEHSQMGIKLLNEIKNIIKKL